MLTYRRISRQGSILHVRMWKLGPKRMQFGLQGAPANFQLLMVKVLSGLNEFSLAYVDDICVFSRGWPSHLEHLQTVFDRLRQHSLRLHPKKCLYGLRQIRYLGHTISAHQTSSSGHSPFQIICKSPTIHTLMCTLCRVQSVFLQINVLAPSTVRITTPAHL